MFIFVYWGCRDNGDVETATRVPYSASEEGVSSSREEERSARGRRVLERGLTHREKFQPQINNCCLILLLARYVPNVAKSSIWDQCEKNSGLTDDRPLIWENSNGHISSRGHPIYFRSTFGSTVEFSGSADRMALFPVGPSSIGIGLQEKTMR